MSSRSNGKINMADDAMINRLVMVSGWKCKANIFIASRSSHKHSSLEHEWTRSIGQMLGFASYSKLSSRNQVCLPVLHIHSVYHGSLKLNMFVKELSFFFPNLDFLSQKCIIIHLLDAKIKVYFQSWFLSPNLIVKPNLTLEK